MYSEINQTQETSITCFRSSLGVCRSKGEPPGMLGGGGGEGGM